MGLKRTKAERDACCIKRTIQQGSEVSVGFLPDELEQWILPELKEAIARGQVIHISILKSKSISIFPPKTPQKV